MADDRELHSQLFTAAEKAEQNIKILAGYIQHLVSDKGSKFCQVLTVIQRSSYMPQHLKTIVFEAGPCAKYTSTYEFDKIFSLY